HSFPSGHTTTAFAFASFVASEHPWYVGVPAYVMASYVGICRMQDNYHYLHDVLAGATIGMSYGIALSQSSKKDEDSKSAFFLAPTDELKGLAFRYNLQF
ncbi:MAG: phosphatase PAP2 family protein, partial [Bacteriovorax sp.]